jgi:hypothetical protein
MLPNQVEHDLNLANDNFEILARAFIADNPEVGAIKKAVHIASTPPQDCVAGTLWFDTSSSKLKLCDGTTWIEVCGGGSGGSSSSPSEPSWPPPADPPDCIDITESRSNIILNTGQTACIRIYGNENFNFCILINDPASVYWIYIPAPGVLKPNNNTYDASQFTITKTGLLSNFNEQYVSCIGFKVGSTSLVGQTAYITATVDIANYKIVSNHFILTSSGPYNAGQVISQWTPQGVSWYLLGYYCVYYAYPRQFNYLLIKRIQ